MRKTTMRLLVVGMLLCCGIAQAHGKVVRATELRGTMLSDFTRGKLGNMVVEFRQGDELPLSFEAHGDLIETRQPLVSSVGIKKDFWLRLIQQDVEISLDGTTFKKIGEVASGSLEAGFGSAQNGGVVDSINIIFNAILK